MQLTDISIKALKPPTKGQVTYTDDTMPGFGVRISQGGIKSFVVVHGRNRRRTTIGRYPTISLQEARKAAKTLLAEQTLGKFTTTPISFEESLKLFLSTHFPANYQKESTKKETTRLLQKHFLVSLRHAKLTDIQAKDISRVIDRLHPTPSEARHAFAAIRQFFNWAARREYVASSPCERLRAPGRAVSRDHVVGHDDLKSIISHAYAEDSTFSTIVLLLLFTGQRRNEIASLQTDWIDFKSKTITLPAHVTKNKRVHTFPFGALAGVLMKAVIEKAEKESPERAKEDKPKPLLLFPARGRDTPFAGWSKAKPDFDKRCAVPHWTLHDLRRTCATNLAALGVPVHVTEKLLNHISGTTSGIVAVYQRHAYMDEMREAIEVWEKHLKSLKPRRQRQG